MILLTVFFFIAVIVFAAFFGLKPEKENGPGQNGGPELPKPPENNTSPLELNWIKHINSGDGSVSIVAEIKNPNEKWGAEKIEYEFALFDGRGEQIDQIIGDTYILPNESKYVVALKVPVGHNVSSIEFSAGNVSWHELYDFVRLDLDVENPKLEEVEDDPTFKTKAIGRIANNSLFGLTDIEVITVIFDNNNNPLDINRTIIHTVLEGEKRDAEMFWPYEINPNTAARLDIQAYSNVFENQNFIRYYDR